MSKTLARRKSYGVSKANRTGATFDFAIGAEEFSVQLPLPGIAVLDLAANAGNDDPAVAVGALGALMRAAMGDDDFARYHASALSARLSIDDIMELVQDLMEAGTGRPTQPQSQSRASSSNAGTGSAVASSGKG